MKRRTVNMTLAEGILFILGIIGAIIGGRKKNYPAMISCLIVTLVMFLLLAATVILVMGID